MIKNSLISLALLIFSAQLYCQKKPNVLMLVIDDLNDYPLKPKFNNVKTPNIDAFSKTALNFENAYCAAPICNPSRASVISGIAPYKSGIYNNQDAWEKSQLVKNSKPIPLLFKENGYTTLWSGKFWHGITTPRKELLEKWWDEYNKHRTFGPLPENPGLFKQESLNRLSNFGAMDLPDEKWQDTRTANETIERLQRSYDKPFFMVCGFVRPHAPWTAPKRFFDMYNPDSISTPNWIDNDWDDIPPLIKKIKSQAVDFDKLIAAGKWEKLLQAYLASISFMDWNFGRVLDALQESDYAENTIVVVWADHGYHVGEKSHIGKCALWEQTTRNMLMIKSVSKESHGRNCSTAVSLLDIYPTLVDLCNLNGLPHNQLDGRSLRPLLDNTSHNWDRPVITTYLKGNHAIRDNRFRYIQYADGEEEFYDLLKDPDEFHNLANAPDYEAEKMSLRKYVPKANADPSGEFKKKK